MKIWVTKAGKEIPYNQLTINHIFNIINYAKTYGFYTTAISKSIVDNSDDIIATYDCSYEVIRDMYAELTSRKKKLKLYDRNACRGCPEENL